MTRRMTLGPDEIQSLIPHRPPFLWIDEVVELTDDSIRARKYLDPQLDVFRGHYPGFPVLPGVLQCEACFQAAAILIAKVGSVDAGEVPVVTRLNNTQFRRMVRPGETLELEAKITERLGKAFFLTGKVSVDGQIATRLEFACTTTEAQA
jgi:3-hydroxyacyl-[acyl-carrier-protein] dehydratase